MDLGSKPHDELRFSMRPEGGIVNALRIGWESARANLMPMLVLQLVVAGLVLAYYLLPPFRSLVEPVADWHRECGWRSAFVSQAVFCGLLPGVFLLAVRSIRPRRPLLTIFAQMLWCGGFGICCDGLFRLMAWTFGDVVRPSTVLAKAAFDQLVWTVAVIAPANAVFFFWLGRDFSFARTRREWPRPFFRRMVLPNLIPNWIVWIPVSLAVFSFPYALQIHVNGLVCTFWTLMCLQIGRRT